MKSNLFGVLDHVVKLSAGLEIKNPMRVILNGNGSKVMFALIQTPDMSDEKHAEDAKLVENDLRILKGLLEGMQAD